MIVPTATTIVPTATAIVPTATAIVPAATAPMLTSVNKSKAAVRDPFEGLFIRQSYIFISYGDEALRLYGVF